MKTRVGVKIDLGLDAGHLKEISEKFLDVVRRETGKDFPQDVIVKLLLNSGKDLRCGRMGEMQGRREEETGVVYKIRRGFPTTENAADCPLSRTA